MAENERGGRRGNRWRSAVWGTAAFLLLLPLVAMQVTDQMAWGAGDFVLFGAMLAAACGTWELAVWMTANRAYRTAVGVAVAAAFLLVWMNLAVGLIGDEGNPANLMYAGVLLVGLIGALVARLQAQGMARALVAMAIAQILVAGFALVSGEVKAVVLTLFFAALWLVSASLFRTAARQQALASAR